MYPEEMVLVLVLAKDSKSLDKNDVVFKPFYFSFFHLFCERKIWFPYVTPLGIDALCVGMADLSPRVSSSLKTRLKTQFMW